MKYYRYRIFWIPVSTALQLISASCRTVLYWITISSTVVVVAVWSHWTLKPLVSLLTTQILVQHLTVDLILIITYIKRFPCEGICVLTVWATHTKMVWILISVEVSSAQHKFSCLRWRLGRQKLNARVPDWEEVDVVVPAMAAAVLVQLSLDL